MIGLLCMQNRCCGKQIKSARTAAQKCRKSLIYHRFYLTVKPAAHGFLQTLCVLGIDTDNVAVSRKEACLMLFPFQHIFRFCI